MFYNRAKYLTDKIGAIFSIILGILIVVTGFLNISTLYTACSSSVQLTPEAQALLNGLWIGTAFRIVVGALFILFGLKTFGEPKWIKTKTKGWWAYSPKGYNITLIVFSAVFVVFGLFFSDLLQFIQTALCVIVLGLKITTLCIIDRNVEDTEVVATTIKTENSAVQKINELKRLKEDGLITEEQYNESVQKLIDNIVK